MELPQRETEERGLRAAVLAGNEAAWETWYARSFDGLYAYVFFRSGRETHLTDEVVQECWLTAVRRIHAFDPSRGSFDAWLRGIANHVLKNHGRQKRRDQSIVSLDAQQATGNDTAAPEKPSEVSESIALAFSALPANYQAALRAKYEQRLSTAEIAGRLGSTTKAVESLLARARAAFRQAYRRADEQP